MLDSYLIIIEINSKQIKDSSRAKPTKFSQENIGGQLHDTGFDNDFLDMIPSTHVRKEKIG